MTLIHILIIAALLIAPVAALIGLRFWMSSPSEVLEEVKRLPDLPDAQRKELLDCLDAAKAADDKTWVYDLSAPLVMLLVLPFLWATVPWADDVDKGIRDIPAMRAAYEAAGRSLVGG